MTPSHFELSFFWIDSRVRFAQLPQLNTTSPSSPYQLNHQSRIPNRHHPTMPPKRISKPETQDGKLIGHPIASLTVGKPVVSQRGRGNPAFLTSSSPFPSPIGGNNGSPHRGPGNHTISISSSTSPSSIWSTSTSSSHATPKQVMGRPSTSSHSSMSSAVTTTPPSKKSTNTFHTPPAIDSNSSMSNAAKKKLKFSPQSNNCPKKQAFLLNFCDRDEVKIECLKYVKHEADLPINQENQLTFLLNQFQVRDIQASFYKLIGKVGGVASSVFTPMSSQKKIDFRIPPSDLRSQIYVDRY